MIVVNGIPTTTYSPSSTQCRKVSRHRVRKSIRRMILNGTFEPGSRLVQGTLAQQLDVSRGVVREALLELQAFGLVDTIDNRGAMVSRIDKEQLIEAYEMREMLEVLAARRCCERITVRDLCKLRDLAEEIYQLHSKGKRVKGARLDHEFHWKLIRIADHRLLERVSSCFWMLGKVTTGKGFEPWASRDAHLKILQDIEAGDADAAERSMRLHIRDGKDRLMKLLEDESYELEWIA